MNTDKLQIGIIGGGQLALFLCEASKKLGLAPRILVDNADEPAAKIEGVEVHFGKIQNSKEVLDFFEGLDRVTFENEFIPAGELKQLSAFYPHLIFQPSLEALTHLQNKLEQKKLLQTLGIPTAPFEKYDPSEGSVNEWLEWVTDYFAEGSVLKWAKGGYDGKGNFFLKDKSQIVMAERFAQEAFSRGSPVYAEELVDFSEELALVACHSAELGEFMTYPLVKSFQQQGICLEVQGPALHLDIPPDLALQASQYALQIARHLNYTGTFAIEFFRTQSGELWVNELAPRVHNSGHFTLSYEGMSQFENHVRALCGLSLQAFHSSEFFLMRNLIGPRDVQSALEIRDDWTPPPPPKDVEVYWYSKRELRAGRKMGHLNLKVASRENLPVRHQELLNYEEKLWKSIRESGV